jgi:hypothetical protein
MIIYDTMGMYCSNVKIKSMPVYEWHLSLTTHKQKRHTSRNILTAFFRVRNLTNIKMKNKNIKISERYRVSTEVLH